MGTGHVQNMQKTIADVQQQKAVYRDCKTTLMTQSQTQLETRRIVKWHEKEKPISTDTTEMALA